MTVFVGGRWLMSQEIGGIAVQSLDRNLAPQITVKNLMIPLKMIVLTLALLGWLPTSGMSYGQDAQKPVDQKEMEAGDAAARKDIARGLIQYDLVGQPSMIDPELQRLAAENYGITLIFHGCTGGRRGDFDRAYLNAVIEHLKARHGFNPVLKIETELRARLK